jgi:undecaprenyl-diphosphatase
VGASDHAVERWITAHRTARLADIARVVTNGGSWWFGTLVAVVAGVLLARRVGRRPVAVAVVAAALLLGPALRALKEVVGRDRPPFRDAVMHLTDPSFPSAHTARAAFVAGVVVLAAASHRGWVIAVAVIYVMAVGWSRVELGVHWLSDTLGAVPIGLLFALPVWLLARGPAPDPPPDPPG